MWIWLRNAVVRRPRAGASVRGESSEMEWGLSLLCLWVTVVSQLLIVFLLLIRSGGYEPNGLGDESVLGNGWEFAPRVDGLGGQSPSVPSRNGSFEELSLKAIRGDVREAESRSDAELVQGVRRGDPAAFEALVRRYIQVAHAVAYSVVGSPDLADDVCQEAFITALQRIDQCRHPDRFRGWFLTIVRNRSLNLKASESFRSGTSLETAGQFAAQENPEKDLERAELRKAIDGAAGQLSGLKKQVYFLHDVEGLSHSEIAGRLGISTGASRVHLHMARKKLKARLSRLWTKEA